ncbi:hypothetical protein HPB48_025551 [Haemaphysalis longicornis]|uniref:Uncharacterized protein n=1 Tax=Haemaphysalis longicornis TaxID=44386 RepID=A0A9J6HAI7_HAELO|nr:hypothetical protein HPB48_025551 [Haemaphysalis longicornis]
MRNRKSSVCAAQIETQTAKAPPQMPAELLEAVVTVANSVSKTDNNGSAGGPLPEKSGRPPELLSPPPSPDKQLAASPSSAVSTKAPRKETPTSQVNSPP